MRRRFRLLLALILGFALATKLVEWTTEAWFFESAGQLAVFKRTMTARSALFLCGVACSALVLGLNLLHARRVAARHHAAPEQRLIPLRDKRTLDRYRRFWGGALLALALLFCGSYAAAHWLVMLRLLAAEPTGTTEPIFGLDVSFYLFTLPALNFGWTFVNATLWAALIAVGVFYIYEEVIEAAGKHWHIADAGLRHLGALGAALLLWKVIGYRLSAWNLLTARGAPSQGFDWTAQNVRLPLFVVLAALTVLATWLLWRASTHGNSRHLWRVPLVWLAANLVVGTLAPLMVERLYVAPRQALLESSHFEIRREATARAYSLDNVQTWGRKAISDQSVRETAASMPLWPEAQLLRYLNAHHRRGDYVFSSLHFDTYDIAGEVRPVFVAARERMVGASSLSDWRATYGYSMVICDAQRRTPDGAPVFYSLPLTRPEIIFGELPAQFGSWPSAPEFGGPPNPLPDVLSRRTRTVTAPSYALLAVDYRGSGGVELNSRLRRVLLAWRFSDRQILSAPADARLVWHRRILDRCAAIAPFWLYDEPRLVVNRGRLTWLVSGLSVADSYPLAASLQGTRLNALRCAVIATVDAFDGTIAFYAADESDALLQSSRRLFPGLFRAWKEFPDDLRPHLAYSPLLLSAQSDVLARVLGPASEEVLRNDVWKVAALRRRSRWNVTQMVPLTPQLTGVAGNRATLQLFTRTADQDDESPLNGNITGILAASLTPNRQTYQPQIRQWQPPEPIAMPKFEENQVVALSAAPVGEGLLLHAHSATEAELRQSWLLLGQRQLWAASLDETLALRWLAQNQPITQNKEASQ